MVLPRFLLGYTEIQKFQNNRPARPQFQLDRSLTKCQQLDQRWLEEYKKKEKYNPYKRYNWFLFTQYSNISIDYL